MSVGLVVLAVIWYVALLAIIGVIVFVLRTLYRIPWVRRILRSIVIEVG